MNIKVAFGIWVDGTQGRNLIFLRGHDAEYVYVIQEWPNSDDWMVDRMTRNQLRELIDIESANNIFDLINGRITLRCEPKDAPA